MATTLTEIEAMIGRIAEGDRDAFLSLYDATSAKLFGVCLRVLRDKAEAEDTLQDAYVKVWKNADRYQANGLSPMTWLITIARNTSIDRVRSRKPAGEGTEALERLSDSEPGPEAQVIAASEAQAIARCLGELETDRAEAVRGAYLDGQTYQDLAARFDVPLNTMRTWLRRSLLKLRECMSA
ncbi:ECF RNA polymerase sigma factor SigK [Rhodobacteraceae bacterium THAF1]|nr:ECF RNA polymerase sigma factor SigK [Palleronia sp. THAF1]VDC27388.1 ECF RNA polymerase sigma factor SigK [Rhodobacteraceae bacterium THAF1]